ncbi:efflux RND transporter periplasmic adaptor subunit [Paraburkholderia fungorum]|jgi:HlyD family secretion protein|uniref:Efflux RND transporter periplasmic adaptor subunit n=1 Tax=Paraburkholderia fungorum TaxID=134537 RepID=A0AAP5USU5_9BURK|nr:efflux RND transporter periplasmic adaptor subunit [Paraburkholderia fungorum]MDT8835842.1 efflux RND transporter periplasmic adaptor subunit [Paraburkholderia fungorum]
MKQERSDTRRGLWRRFRGPLIGLAVVAMLIAALKIMVFRPPVVMVATVTVGDLAAEVEGTGTVTADILADVAPKITGRVEQVFANEGDAVQRWQIVAPLDQTDSRSALDAARARLAAAKATAGERQREWNREKTLIQTGAVSTEDAQQYEERLSVAQKAVEAAAAESRTAEYNLSLTQVPSLVSGIVTRRWAVLGESVVPGQRMFTVADTHVIYVNTHLDQDSSGKLRQGEAATVVLRGRESQPLMGRVLRISPQADAATEETVAEVAFTIPPDEFQLDQWANVYIRVGEARHALIVPRAAVMPMGKGKFVFVVDAGNVLRREAVVVLAESPRRPMVAIAGGLHNGDRMVLMPMGRKAGERVRPQAAGGMPDEEGGT